MHLEKAINEFLSKAMKVERDWVIYCDTDSVYVNLQDVVDSLYKGKTTEETVKWLDKFCEDVLQKIVNKSTTEVFDNCNCHKKLMSAKREAIASKAIWTAKKRYAMMVHNSEGVDYKPYKLKIMGLDMIKTSTPHWVRDKLKKTLTIIFEQGELDLRKFVEEVKKDFYNIDVELIAFPKSVNDIDKWYLPKDSKQYKKGTPIGVRAAILYNAIPGNAGTIQNKDKIKFAYMKLPNPIKEDVMGFPTDGKFPKALTNYVDRELQWEKVFISPLKGLTDAISWSLVEVSTLESFFG